MISSRGPPALLTLEKQASVVKQATIRRSGRRLAALVDDRSIVVTDVADLVEAVDKLGLKGSTPKTAVAWSGPLWAPRTEQMIAQENLVIEFLPKAASAERAKDWQEAVRHLTRLLDVEPDNKAWRLRRSAANEQLMDWPAVAVDRAYVLDLLPYDFHFVSARSQSLGKLLRDQPEVYAALEKLRPKDPLLPVARGRELARKSKWQEAKSAYASVIQTMPASEDWYDYAALCLLSGDRKAAHDHVSWMAMQKGQPANEYIAYCYTRAAGVVADPRCHAEAIKWAETATAKQRNPWFLNAAALVYYRAEQWHKAKETLQEALKAPWHCHVLNQLALGMVEHKLGNDETAKDLLEAARKWQKTVESQKQNGYVNVLLPDWIEFNVLLPELEALVGHIKFPEPLRGHKSPVYCVVFSPDGKRIASATGDSRLDKIPGEIAVWNAATGKEIFSFAKPAHDKSIWSLAFDQNGKRLVSSSWDNTVGVWDALTGKKLQTFQGHTGHVNSVAFCPDGKQVASAGDDGTIRIWDASTSKESHALKKHAGSIWGLAYSLDGKRLASASHDKTVKVWDPATGKELLHLAGHPKEVWHVAFSPDGKRLASCSDGRSVKIWDAHTGKELHDLQGHGVDVYCVAFSADGKLLASGGGHHWQPLFPGEVKIWNTSTGKLVRSLAVPGATVFSIAFQPDGHRLIAGTGDNTIRVWDMETGK